MSKSLIDDLLLGPDRPTNADGTQTSFLTELIAACHNCARAAQALPHGPTFDYFKTYPAFVETTKTSRAHIWDTISDLGAAVSRSQDKDTLTTLNTDTLRFRALTEIVDDTLEEVTTRLHKAEYGNKDKSLSAPTPFTEESGVNMFSMMASLQRPQDRFKIPVDNSLAPWRPVLKEKFNAIVPLDRVIVEGLDNGSMISYPHPYERELEELAYPASQLSAQREELYRGVDHSKVHWVDNVDELMVMEEKLRKVNCIAIDLEHHSFRSYLGFTCLMQVSTRTEDFLVDTIALREELHVLNSSFTNPNIVKVLHGANMDILWLQRDLGLYIINLFDTGQAARLLDMKSFSLASLLSHYCDVKADKKYQTADWRIRPLPVEMMMYAREDTHYLLYIYDRLRNELVDKTALLLQGNPKAAEVYGDVGTVKTIGKTRVKVPFLLAACLNRSRDICKITFEKELDLKEAALNLRDKTKKNMDEIGTQLLVDLYAWRDTVAREHDESTGYVLSNAMLLSIVKALPTDPNALARVCKPMSGLVKSNIDTVVGIVTKALTGSSARHYPRTSLVSANSTAAMPSPVMSKEQLYHAARWDVKLEINASSSLAQANADAASLTMRVAKQQARARNVQIPELISGVPLFDAEGIITAKKQANPLATPPPKRASGLLSLGEQQLKKDKEIKASKLDSVRNSLGAFSFTPFKLKSDAQVKEEAMTDADPLGLGEGIAGVEELSGLDWDASQNTSQTPQVGRLAVLQSPASVEAKLGNSGDKSLGDIPYTMRDIYKLSNKNKANNTAREEKKKEDRKRPLVDDDIDGDNLKKDDEIMQEAGWINETKDSKDEATPFIFNQVANPFTDMNANTLNMSIQSGGGFYNPHARRSTGGYRGGGRGGGSGGRGGGRGGSRGGSSSRGGNRGGSRGGRS